MVLSNKGILFMTIKKGGNMMQSVGMPNAYKPMVQFGATSKDYSTLNGVETRSIDRIINIDLFGNQCHIMILVIR